MSGEEGSITRWYAGLKAGDREAVGPLWDRYFARMIRLARATLRGGVTATADEEDAAVSAFESFVAGVERGRFPEVADREDLWRVLAIITVRKAKAQVRRDRRLKRGGGLVVRETDLAANGSDDEPLDGLAGPDPEPGFVALAREELARLLDLLGDDTLRQVAILRMEGFTCDEVAARLGCARRTVARQLDLIRKIWTEVDATGSP